MPIERVLFICTNNSARSQMAEGYLKHVYGAYYEVHSAGTNPQTLNPYAIKVMGEIGFDISKYHSKGPDIFEGMEFDHVITLCGEAGQVCPFFLGGKNYKHKGFKDPAAVEAEEMKKLRFFEKLGMKLYPG